MKTIEVQSTGEPKLDRKLTDSELQLIVAGLLIPRQGAAKSMAEELLELRGQNFE